MMPFSPCLVVPCYNHGAMIRRTIAGLRVHGLPIFIVDDGSDESTRLALEALAADEPLLRLSRLPHNQGKGAAVMQGMRAALAAGFSHALQVDADGQHATADVPRFLDMAEREPDAVICGRPVYDDSVPRARLYGRYLTHVWVWIETLSFQIADSMCGYRCYPLTAAVALMDRVSIPARMDFDTEIVVRLYWQGLPIRNLPTSVTYPLDGLSHFDALRDNVRISRMHARLFFAMLPRAPGLLWRNLARARQTHWSRMAERGSVAGLKTVFWAYRLLGPTIVGLMLHPIVFYFALTGRQARESSQAFMAQVGVLPTGALARLRLTYRHLYAFAEAAVDKMAAWMGRIAPEQVVVATPDCLHDLQASGRGALLVGAHLGNLEMCRALASHGRMTRINAVVYSRHAARFTDLLRQASPDYAVNLIQVQEMGVDTAILLKQKIDQGEWVVIVGDRTPVSENGRVCRTDFLGAPASFAQGPWILASLLECPVYLFFCLKEGRRYQLYLESFAEQVCLPRGQREARLRELVGQYASRLGHYARKAPLQWFNFYDFWRPETGRAKG